MARDIRVQAVRDRFVLLHYHIFKNAGSTVDSVLQRHFGDGLVALHGEQDDARLVAGDVLALLDEDPSVRAITSHHLRYPKPVRHGLVVWDACVLRHPLDRIRSLYHYGRKIGPAGWLGELAHDRDESAFVSQLLRDAPYAISDVQVHFFANASAFTRPANAADLRIAEEIVRDAAMIGVVDLFDESLVTAEYFLAPVFPGLSMAHVAQNVSSPHGVRRGADEDALSEACRAAWGDALYADVAALNAWDFQLYRIAREEVLRRFSLLPNGLRRLEDYRERCVRLSAT